MSVKDDGLGRGVADAQRCAGDAGAYWYRIAADEAARLLELKPDAIRLACGEVTPQEMRTVQAVLRWRASVIRRLAGGAKLEAPEPEAGQGKESGGKGE